MEIRLIIQLVLFIGIIIGSLGIADAYMSSNEDAISKLQEIEKRSSLDKEQTSLLLAGLQTSVIWMLLFLVVAGGANAFFIRRRCVRA